MWASPQESVETHRAWPLEPCHSRASLASRVVSARRAEDRYLLLRSWPSNQMLRADFARLAAQRGENEIHHTYLSGLVLYAMEAVALR